MAVRAPTLDRDTSTHHPGHDHDVAPDPVESAREAGLRYVSDDRPGIRRQRAARGFRYRRPDGSPVRDEPTLRRIKARIIGIG